MYTSSYYDLEFLGPELPTNIERINKSKIYVKDVEFSVLSKNVTKLGEGAYHF